jgi:hypothetical protein
LSADDWSSDGRFLLYHFDTTRELMALPPVGVLARRTVDRLQRDRFRPI